MPEPSDRRICCPEFCILRDCIPINFTVVSFVSSVPSKLLVYPSANKLAPSKPDAVVFVLKNGSHLVVSSWTIDVPVIVRICPCCTVPETPMIVGVVTVVAARARAGRHPSVARSRQNGVGMLMTRLLIDSVRE